MKDKIYDTKRQIKSILKVQSDVDLTIDITFFFEEEELNKIHIQDAKSYNPKTVLDSYAYFDNCDKISYLITGTNGYKREIVLEKKKRR